MLDLSFTRPRATVVALVAWGLLVGCEGGEGAVDAGCQALDGGSCWEGFDEPRTVRVDCCDIQSEVQWQLCDDLYRDKAPTNLIIEDTCNAAEDDAGAGSGSGDCEGLTGLQAILCQFQGGGGGATDPCDGLEGLQLTLCQITGGSGDGGQTPAGPLGELATGLQAITDIVNGLGTLADLLGLNELFNGDAGQAQPDASTTPQPSDAGAGSSDAAQVSDDGGATTDASALDDAGVDAGEAGVDASDAGVDAGEAGVDASDAGVDASDVDAQTSGDAMP